MNVAALADPVLDAQAIFRAVMEAMVRPGSRQRLAANPEPPAPLVPGIAAIALTLADHETTVWLSPRLATAAVAQYLRFHTGARIVASPAEAAFALAASLDDLPSLDAFAQGSDEYPDRSTTIVAAVDALVHGAALTLSGPGIDGSRHLAVSPWPAGLTDALARNRARFPRGVDLVLVAGGEVAALPRTTMVREG